MKTKKMLNIKQQVSSRERRKSRKQSVESKKHILAAFILIWLALLPGLCLGATTNQISQFSITWTFDKEYEYGQFANGDYWVVGPVNIVEIDPASIIDGTGRTMNGSMIDPDPAYFHTIDPESGMVQGFDSTGSGWNSSLNVARPSGNDLSADNPLVIGANHSLISSISDPLANQRPQQTDAAILTILGSVPEPNSFRPAYAGTDKSIKYSISNLDYSSLQSLTPVASAPSLATAEGWFVRPWLDWGHQLEDIHAKNNMPTYGRDIASRLGDGALFLNLNYTNAQKQTLIISYVQIGIDLYTVLVNGGRTIWRANGGHSGGRKLPILFAGTVLNDSNMTTAVANKSGDYLYEGAYGPGHVPPDYYHFGEDDQTFYVSAEDIYSQPYELKYSNLPQSGGTKTGGVKVTHDSNIVEGVGTSWLNINLANNPFFAVKNDIDAYMAVRPVTEVVISGNTYYYPDYVIESIDSNTQLTLNKAYRGDTNQTGNAEYVIARIVWYGHGNTKYRYDTDEFTNEHLGLPEWAIKYALVPNEAGTNWGVAYRGTAGSAFSSIALPALMMDLKEVWNHDAFFDYTDRYLATMVGVGRSDSQFAEDMWDEYRGNYPPVWPNVYFYGDVNGNGEVTSYDAALAARYAVGLEVFTDEQRQKADVSANGEVSAYDAALIAQKAVGLIERFPVEEDLLSFSPLTKLWNFLKGLLTKETGQAILTGKITGDAVDEADETAENGNYEKTLLVISVAVLVVVLIIIAMKFAKTKKKVKRVRKH